VDSEFVEEESLRPGGLADFVGQTALKEKLSISLRACLARGEALDHVLFSGPPGLGKTTLASIIAKELGRMFHSTSAPALTKPGDLARMLTILETGDVLFIDEIHRLNRPCEEILYPAMEDGFIDIILGEGVTARSIQLPLKPFTLVGATTRSGLLTAPLKSRFGIDLKLEFYSPEELTKIVRRTSQLLQLPFTEEACAVTAARSRMTPRIANRLVRRIRDYATVEKLHNVDADFALNCLEKLGVDTLGLHDADRRFLSLMADRYHGGPVGVKTLAALMDEEERTLEEDHEPFLLRMALIEKTPQGRILTEKAWKHLGRERDDGLF
jgi:Holliday junction DNA helicase RuvB